ncbi:MAG: hypothetical protein C5B52_15395 [Bacteroidetes bacterium]|nr:MAG: hypothetical protein C5B52_15395 [Bacteroidota bacterium]
MNEFYSIFTGKVLVKSPALNLPVKPIPKKRIVSIDLLRGTVMIIMALDHVRHSFNREAFFFEPTDLTQTTPALFFTRFVTHYCAPVFVFLAGISAYLSGVKKTRRELSEFLIKRGLWLIFIELFVIILANTYNPTYSFLNLQVIWAIGISMIVLAGLIHLSRNTILLVGIILVAFHNLLDPIHISGNNFPSFIWSVLHEPGVFHLGRFTIYVMYPVLPWIGIMAIGYYFGKFYDASYDPVNRRDNLLTLGVGAIILFLILRTINIYGDPAPWSIQKNGILSFLSIINVTKYPPSLLYTLITLGPALIFLALTERPLNGFTERVSVFGRVPFFYYVLHLYFIHALAMIASVAQGYGWRVMILTTRMNNTVALKGYGFNLFITYLIYFGLIILLYPFCWWFDKYKRAHQFEKPWLSYL